MKKAILSASFFLITSLLAVGSASAGYVYASADMNLANLRFTFDDPNAFLVWEDDWYGTVTAYAQGASGMDDDFAELLGNNGFIEAEAQSSDVYSLATYEVVNGQYVAIESDASVAATTHSELELIGKNKQADGFANADFDNFFSVSSTEPLGETVQVTILLDYAGQLTGIADEGGYFDIFAGTFAELYNTRADDFGNAIVTDLLDYDLFFDAASGSNTSYFNPFAGTLSITRNLAYNQIYWLYAQADSEVYGAVVPAPGTLPLLLLGIGIFACLRRR